MSSILDWFDDNKDKFVDVGVKIILAIVIWYVGKWIIKKLAAALERAMLATKQDPTISAFLSNVAGSVLKVMLAVSVIGFAGFDTGPFTALLAGATFAVAYSFQDSLGHVAGGLLLLYQKQMKTGDLVMAADVTGVCSKIEVFFSTIQAPTGRAYICPNGNVAFAPIHNVSTNKYVRAEIEFEVDNSYNLGEIRNFLVDAMQMNAHVEFDPEPDVVVRHINEETVTLVARAWISADHYLEYRHAFLFDVYVRFNRSELSLLEDGDEGDDGADGADDGDGDGEGGTGGEGEEQKAGGDLASPAKAAAKKKVDEVRKVSATFVPDEL